MDLTYFCIILQEIIIIKKKTLPCEIKTTGHEAYYVKKRGCVLVFHEKPVVCRN